MAHFKKYFLFLFSTNLFLQMGLSCSLPLFLHFRLFYVILTINCKYMFK